MDFQTWKKLVVRFAKRANKVHLVPADNELILLWEQKLEPKQVVEQLNVEKA